MSFGSGFGGFGSTNNQQSTPFGSAFGSTPNNQQQASTGGFGTTGTTGFGASGTTGGSLFGSGGTSTGFGTGGFGSQTQSRPFGAPATSTGGSLFGASTTQTSGTGFGGFGSTATTNPTTGFGSTTGGLFGQSGQTQSGFGTSTGGGLFGSSSGQTTGFGQTQPATGFGQTQQQQQPQNNGTGSVPFQPYTEKDSVGTTSQQFQSIVCQQPYQPFSFEELRTADYNQGRRYGNGSGQAGAFGQATGFGGGFGQTSTTGFGSSTGGGLFGSQQNQQAQGTSGFGQTGTSTGFGSSTTGGGLFGAKSATGTGLFGNTNTSAPSTGGLFGTSGGTTGFGQSTGGFGGTTATGGLFGNQNNQPKPGGLFGSSTGSSFGQTTTGGFGTGTTGGLFGNNAASNPNQTSGFGQNTQTNSLFGGFGQNQNQNQQQQQQQQPQTNNLFGSTTTGANLFGQNQNQQKTSLFGTSSTTGGLFGQNNQQQNQQQPANNLFGNLNNQQNQTGNLFGQNNNQQKSLFGATQPAASTGTGLFGGGFGNNQQNNGTQNNNLFGQTTNNQQKPSLFGNSTTTTGGNLFGTFGQTNNQQQNAGSSLFGSTAQNNQQQPLGGSLLNSMQQQPAAQQPQYLTTSIAADNPYGNDQLFQSLATPTHSVGPLVTPLSSAQKPKQRTPLPTYRLNPGASSRLLTPQRKNGYGFDYSTYGTPGSATSNASPAMSASRFLGGSFGRSLGKSASTSNLRGSFNEDSILAPGAFSANGIRGGGAGSLKKLKINRTLRTDLFGPDASNDTFQASPLKKRVSFEGESSTKEAEGSENSTDTQPGPDNALVRREDAEQTQPTAEEQGYLRTSRNTASSSNGSTARKEMEQINGKELAIVPEDEASSAPVSKPSKQGAVDAARAAHRDMEPGNYYMIPSRAEIEKMSKKERSNISPFIVGREYTGKIEFEKVDLSNVDLDKIFGDIVRIETRSATVYADHTNKPEPGKGMNFPAVVTLENSWPRSKGGKLPIFERKGPRFEKHLERLKRVSNTEFINYDVETGEWIFRVPHFSTYTFDYSDDESMLSPAPDTPHGGRSGLLPRAARGAPVLDDDGLSSAGSYEGNDMDDTFEFRNSRQLPGAFEGDVVSDDEMDLHNGFDDNHHQNGSDDQDVPVASIEPDESSVFENGPVLDQALSLDGSFDEPSSATRSGLLISPIKGSHIKPKSILKESTRGPTFNTTTRFTDDDWATQIYHTLSPKKQDRQALRDSHGPLQVNAHMAKPKSTVFSRESNPFATSIDVMNSLFGRSEPDLSGTGYHAKWPTALQNSSSDESPDSNPIEQAFRQSFQPSWASNAKLASLASRNATDSKRITGLEEELQEDVPFATPSGEIPFAKLADEASDDTAASRHEKSMWQLANILFGPLDSSDSADEAEKRRSLLSAFWQSLVEPAASQQMSQLKDERRSSAEEAALVSLSCHDIWAAAEKLSNAKDFRLGTMIALLGQDMPEGDGMRNLMQSQIDDWRKSDMWSEFAPAVRALYELLAGNTCISLGKTGASENRAETFNISSRFGFDWRRSFALRLWYATAPADPIETAVLLYAEDVDTGVEAIKPQPWFVEENAEVLLDEPKLKESEDVLLSLLKIYTLGSNMRDVSKIDVNLSKWLSPLSLTGNPTDSRLSFQLYQFLRTLNIIDFSDDANDRDRKADQLTTDYAFQLSSKPDHLVDAIFVTLHLSEPTARETAIRALLTQNAGEIDGEPSDGVFKTLVEDLSIPTNWIWNAKAEYANVVLKDRSQQCICLIRGEEFNKAHEVLLQSLAPQCIIEEDRRTLIDVLETLESQKSEIKDWTVGGAILKDYISIMQIADRGGNAQEGIDKAKGMKSVLEDWQQSDELMVRVAAEEIVKNVESALLVFQRRLGIKDGSEMVVKSMPVADEEVLKEAMKASEEYYKRLAGVAA